MAEGRIRTLLYDFGYDGSAYRPRGEAHARWAADMRGRFGPEIGARLIELHHATKRMLESQPTTEPDPNNPLQDITREAAERTAPEFTMERPIVVNPRDHSPFGVQL